MYYIEIVLIPPRGIGHKIVSAEGEELNVLREKMIDQVNSNPHIGDDVKAVLVASIKGHVDEELIMLKKKLSQTGWQALFTIRRRGEHFSI